ncbi:hypothetical protein RF11_02196 [Thelohanellus kitauei]|uniref:Uncharacterized protein n=1 Tax=Thelohanellus kitauei TaxID=669202 RepID=A0A0C2J2S4_THEKT|nr:hypothetical protein RF11_02196 [Thelohanellus kitauei]
MSRECSWKMMRYFVSQSQIENFQLIGISGELSHSRISVQKTLKNKEILDSERDVIEQELSECANMIERMDEFYRFLEQAFEELQKDIKMAEISNQLKQSKPLTRAKKFGKNDQNNNKAETKENTLGSNDSDKTKLSV